MPGGWEPGTEGVILIEQSPAPLIFLTAADTEIQILAQAITSLPAEFPTIRACNLLNLQQPFTIDDYSDKVLTHAMVIIVRLLGRQSYWPYGLEVLQDLKDNNSQLRLFIMPGENRPDPALMHHSSVPLTAVHRLWQYWGEGGIENCYHSLLWLSDYVFATRYQPPPPQPVPAVGIYHAAIANP